MNSKVIDIKCPAVNYLHVGIDPFAQVKNFILFGDIHKSIYFLCWKEDGAQLTLLAKDFGSLDCYATEFLIDGSTLSLLVSDSRKNLQVCAAPLSSFPALCTPNRSPRSNTKIVPHSPVLVLLYSTSAILYLNTPCRQCPEFEFATSLTYGSQNRYFHMLLKAWRVGRGRSYFQEQSSIWVLMSTSSIVCKCFPLPAVLDQIDMPFSSAPWMGLSTSWRQWMN